MELTEKSTKMLNLSYALSSISNIHQYGRSSNEWHRWAPKDTRSSEKKWTVTTTTEETVCSILTVIRRLPLLWKPTYCTCVSGTCKFCKCNAAVRAHYRSILLLLLQLQLYVCGLQWFLSCSLFGAVASQRLHPPYGHSICPRPSPTTAHIQDANQWLFGESFERIFRPNTPYIAFERAHSTAHTFFANLNPTRTHTHSLTEEKKIERNDRRARRCVQQKSVSSAYDV